MCSLRDNLTDFPSIAVAGEANFWEKTSPFSNPSTRKLNQSVSKAVDQCFIYFSHGCSWNLPNVIESFSVASAIEVADAAVKSASFKLIAIHLGMAIGGKAFITLAGEVAATTEALSNEAAVVKKKGWLVEKVVIPSPRPEIISEFV
jgi:hypothetical protein